MNDSDMEDRFINMTDTDENITIPTGLGASLEKMLDGMAAVERIMAEDEPVAGTGTDFPAEEQADGSRKEGTPARGHNPYGNPKHSGRTNHAWPYGNPKHSGRTNHAWPYGNPKHGGRTTPSGPDRRRKFIRLVSGLSAAAAVAIVSIAGYGLWLGSAPADTFDNPQLAYLEVEKALDTISGHLQDSSSEMERTEKMIDRQREKLQNINHHPKNRHIQ